MNPFLYNFYFKYLWFFDWLFFFFPFFFCFRLNSEIEAGIWIGTKKAWSQIFKMGTNIKQ